MQGFDEQKLQYCTAEKKRFLKLKIANNLSLGLHEGRPSYRISLQPSKKTSRTSKPHISSHFSISFCGSRIISALLDPDPDVADQNQSGSGSTTLVC
jgi:hypothetical protein